MFVFDDAELENVAKILFVTNPAVAERWYDEDGLVSYMRTTAIEVFGDTLGFVSTGGFVLTAYKTSDGNIGVRATLSEYNIRKYLEKVGLYNTVEA